MTECQFCKIGFLGFPNCICPVCKASCNNGFGVTEAAVLGTAFASLYNAHHESCTDDRGSKCVLGKAEEFPKKYEDPIDFLRLVFHKTKEGHITLETNLETRQFEIIEYTTDGIFIHYLPFRLLNQT